jgi:hypothetical protein
MKLRIRGDSVRLRLTKGEVAALAGGNAVEETTRLGLAPDQWLRYSMQTSAAAKNISAQYAAGAIVVTVPLKQAQDWAVTDAVGISAEQPAGGNGVLRILIEKDFACLERREDDSDAFPNPRQSVGD